MTPDPDTMPAGREMDKLVAEKVMDWGGFWESPDGVLLYGDPPHNTIEDDRIPVPHYSTDLGDTKEVIQRLRKAGWVLSVEHIAIYTGTRDPYGDHDDLFDVEEYRACFMDLEACFDGSGTTIEQAVCNAALAVCD